MSEEFHEVKNESRVSVLPRDIFLYGLAGIVAGMMKAGVPMEHGWSAMYREFPGDTGSAVDLMVEAEAAVKKLSAIIDEHGVSN